jgi:hypothetical protein
MGCNDYYDPSREREDKNWRRNNELINRSNCKRFRTAGSNDYVGCCECGAMVFTGDLWQEEDLPWVRAHHHWHSLLPRPLAVAGVGHQPAEEEER